jgi:hypothetical protein
MPKKKKNNNSGTKRQSSTNGKIDIQSTQFWREVAEHILPDEEEKSKIMELATALQLLANDVSKDWKKIDRVARAQDGLSLGVSIKIDRSITPSVIEVNGNYSERHSFKSKSDCPDPNAPDLPGLSREEMREETKKGDKEEDTAGKEETVGTGEPGY